MPPVAVHTRSNCAATVYAVTYSRYTRCRYGRGSGCTGFPQRKSGRENLGSRLICGIHLGVAWCVCLLRAVRVRPGAAG